MKWMLDIIREDPKAFVIDAFAMLGMFCGIIGAYIILACLVP